MHSMDKDGTETAGEIEHRATSIAGRLANLAVPGFPPLDLLKARGARFSARVAQKLDAVPPERQQASPATVATPAALQYALLGDGDEVADLCEMFENLLVSSMDSAMAANAHPAFVSMISQLTPDEARILKSIDRDEYALIQVLKVGASGTQQLGSWTLLGIGAGIDESRQQQYLSNLERLGILRSSNVTSSSAGDYDTLDDILDKTIHARAQQRYPRSKGSIVVTPLGRQFLDTCVRARGR